MLLVMVLLKCLELLMVRHVGMRSCWWSRWTFFWEWKIFRNWRFSLVIPNCKRLIIYKNVLTATNQWWKVRRVRCFVQDKEGAGRTSNFTPVREKRKFIRVWAPNHPNLGQNFFSKRVYADIFLPSSTSSCSREDLAISGDGVALEVVNGNGIGVTGAIGWCTADGDDDLLLLSLFSLSSSSSSSLSSTEILARFESKTKNQFSIFQKKRAMNKKPPMLNESLFIHFFNSNN